ncbi:MAG TPA: hypothetical protein VK864_05765 [Longimicrobiales bacterium]|nr:hypothetical protein [Longimicrobiales bacterium]
MVNDRPPEALIETLRSGSVKVKMLDTERARLLLGGRYKQCPDTATTMLGYNEKPGQPWSVL